jgi:hypothetical protein
MMRIRGKEENQSNWWLTVQRIGRFYPPADVPLGLHTIFTEERRKAAAMQQNHQEGDDSKDDRHSK